MKIVLISDTHNQHRRVAVPDGDVLVHAGDITISGEKDVYADFIEWFSSQPHKTKVFIGGNHDFNLEGMHPTNYALSITDPRSIHYLFDSGVVIDGIKFYGSPWTPRFFDWAFMLDRGDSIRSKWDLIHHDTDVLITHGPPAGILDRPFGKRAGVGCQDLADAVFRIKPKVHVFGHIHGDYGVKSFNGTTFVNASVVDETYFVCNDPVVVEV